MYAIREKPFEGINGALYVVRGMANTVDSVSKLVDSGMLLIEQNYGFKLHMEGSTLLVRS